MEYIDVVTERRSVANFDPSFVISDEEIKKICDYAALAPSSMNLQPWKVIAVKSKEKKEILMKAAMNQRKVVDASVVFIVIADTKALEEHIDRVLENWVNLGYLDKKTAEGYKNFSTALYGKENTELKRKLFAIKNASFFAMNLMICAKSLGFDSHPMDGFDEKAIKKNFSIPEDNIVPLIIAVGKHDKSKKLLPRAMRFKFEESGKIV